MPNLKKDLPPESIEMNELSSPHNAASSGEDAAAAAAPITADYTTPETFEQFETQLENTCKYGPNFVKDYPKFLLQVIGKTKNTEASPSRQQQPFNPNSNQSQITPFEEVLKKFPDLTGHLSFLLEYEQSGGFKEQFQADPRYNELKPNYKKAMVTLVKFRQESTSTLIRIALTLEQTRSHAQLSAADSPEKVAALKKTEGLDIFSIGEAKGAVTQVFTDAGFSHEDAEVRAHGFLSSLKDCTRIAIPSTDYDVAGKPLSAMGNLLAFFKSQQKNTQKDDEHKVLTTTTN